MPAGANAPCAAPWVEAASLRQSARATVPLPPVSGRCAASSTDADRLVLPPTRLAATAILEEDGWCDDPADPLYNRPIKRPYAGKHERLWRADALYDLIVVLGHNDGPVVPGAGSAIFLHQARADWGPTEGCVALALPDLLMVAAEGCAGDRVVVRPLPDHGTSGKAPNA